MAGQAGSIAAATRTAMGIANYPAIMLILLLSAAFLPRPQAASMTASAADGPCAVCPGDVRLLDVDAALGRWLQVAATASAAITCRTPPVANVSAHVWVLGMRAGFQHDAAGFATSFEIELPRLPDGALRDLFRFRDPA